MLITNFAAGELSPRLYGRVDLQQYYSGASRINNFDIIPTGGIKRRKGFKHCGKMSGPARIIPFIVNKDNSFIFEFTVKEFDDGVRGVAYIWKNGEKIIAPESSTQKALDDFIYTYGENEQLFIFTPYTSLAVINEIQYAQDYDTLVFAHKDAQPYEVKWNSGTSFTYALMTFDFWPNVSLTTDDDYDYINIVEVLPSFEAALENIDKPYYIADGQLWLFHKEKNPPEKEIKYEAIKIAGVTWYLWYERVDEDPDVDPTLFTDENKRPGAVTYFNGRLWFASTREKPQKIWASATPDTKGNRYNDFSTWQKYVTVEKQLKDPDIHIFSGDVENVAVYQRVSLTEQTFQPGVYYEIAVTYTYIYLTQETFVSNKYYTYENGVYRLAQTYSPSEIYYEKSDVYNLSYYYESSRTYYRIAGSHQVTEITNLTQDLTKKLEKDATLYFITQAEYIQQGTKVLEVTPTKIVLDRPVMTQKDLKGITFMISLWQNAENPAADDYEYKVLSRNMTTSDVSFNFELASDQNDAVKWIGAGKYLAVATESSIWGIPASVTALNLQAEMNGRYGSDGIQGHCVGSAMIYFAQGNKAIREYYWDNNQEAFRTNDIAILAEHLLTESGAHDFDFATNPYNRIIIVRDDGTAASLLYDKNNGVMAWSRISHGQGKLKSCAITRGDEESDLLYFAVENNGDWNLECLETAEKIFLDSYRTYNENEVIDDNMTIWNVTTQKYWDLKDGPLPSTFIKAEDEVYAGYRYTSEIKSLPVIAGDPTAKKRIVNLIVRFNDSWMPVMKCANTEEYFTDIEKPFTGQKKIDYAGNSDRDVIFTLVTDEVHPVEILSVNAVLD